jgi:hypothetical protein
MLRNCYKPVSYYSPNKFIAMPTKIIIRTSIIVMLTAVLACKKEDNVVPIDQATELKSAVQTLEADMGNTSELAVLAAEDREISCTEKPCSEVLPGLVKFYRELANATCETQWYCTTCCLQQHLTTIKGSVKPTNPACFEVTTDNDDPSLQPVPALQVVIIPQTCYKNGAMLWAANPSIAGNPAYEAPDYTVKWYRNNQLIGTGALLSDCVCGDKITVVVKSNQTVQQGTAIFSPKPCVFNQ